MGQGASLIRNDIHTTHVYTTSQRNNTNLASNNQDRPTSPEMVCESCSASFNIFNRKKLCKDCGRYFCANCVMQLQQNVKRSHRQCKKCNILTTGNFTRQDLQKWKVKDLRSVLNKRNISTEACTEKHDLIDLLVITFGVVSQGNSGDRSSSTAQTTITITGNRGDLQEQESTSTSSSEQSPSPQGVPVASRAAAGSVPSSVNNQQRSQSLQEPQAQHVEEPQRSHSLQQNESEAARAERLRQRQLEEMRVAERLMEEMRRADNEHQVQQERAKRYTLDNIKSEEDIETLTVRQMKEVLVNNFVDYKGCVEKTELQQKVTRLWKEHQNNKQKTQEIINASENAPGGVATSAEDELCKICMDAAINCVLLECGHMVTCTQCGRRLAECPICRQNVVRAVHIFRS